MTQVLQRASDIIDLLASDERSWTISEIATACQLHPATTTRLLKYLVSLGWADQEYHRGSYRLGPRIQLLADRQPYRWRLIDAARPVVEACCQFLKQGITLAAIRQNKRLVLIDRLPDGRSREDLSESEDLYQTAGGRIMLACLPGRQRQRIIDQIGLPDAKSWPGILTRKELLSECRQLKRQGWAFNNRRPRYCSMAVVIITPEGEVASIGSHAPAKNFRKDSLDHLQSAAERILHRLQEP